MARICSCLYYGFVSRLTSSSPSYSQYTHSMKPLHVAHTQLEVYGLYYTWFILHLVYSTLVLFVWFCLSEHRSNLIRSPTRSRSSPRLGPTGDFRFLWQSLPAARFTRLRHFSFSFVSPRLSLAVVTWGATEPRGKIGFIFEKGMRFEQNLRSTVRGRSGKMDLRRIWGENFEGGLSGGGRYCSLVLCVWLAVRNLYRNLYRSVFFRRSSFTSLVL